MGGFTVFDIDYSKQRVCINTQLRWIEQHKCYFKQKSNEKILLKFKKQRLYKLLMRIFFTGGIDPPNPVAKYVTGITVEEIISIRSYMYSVKDRNNAWYKKNLSVIQLISKVIVVSKYNLKYLINQHIIRVLIRIRHC